MSKSLSVGNNPKINLDRVGGDISISGWDGSELLIKADDDDSRVQQTGEAVSISSNSDLSLRVPKGASLVIKSIGGDASIRGILGSIEIREIQGELSVRDVGALSIDTVSSDFSLRGAKHGLYGKSARGVVRAPKVGV